MPIESETQDDAKSRPPRRVRVAPLAPIAAAMSAGIVIDRFLDPWATAAWAALALAGAALAGAAWRRPRASSWAIAAAFVALGGSWHHRCWTDLEPDDLARGVWTADDRRPAWIRGVLDEPAAYRPGGGDRPDDRGSTRAVIAVTGWNDGRGWHPASGRVQAWIAGDRSDLEAGRPVEAAGTLGAIQGPPNPGEFDPRPMLRARGIRLRLAVDEPGAIWDDPRGEPWPTTRRLNAVRSWSARTLSDRLDPGVAPLASALLLGRREAVDPDVNDAFARTGTTHLLAISGLHLQVLAAVLAIGVRLLGMGRRGAFATVALGTVAYAILVGPAPSVARSAAMTVGVCLAGWCDRRTRPANLLAGALLATLLLNPANLFDVGCQLSFLAVAAILWCVPGILAWDRPVLSPLDSLERQLEPWWRMLGRTGWVGLRAGVRLSAAVWLAAWPLVALRFHLIAPIGIPINIPLIPLTSLALLLAGLTLALAAIWAPLAIPSAWLCGLSLRLTERIVRWGMGVPWGHAFVPGPGWASVAVFYGLLGLAVAAGTFGGRRARWAWGAALTWGAALAFAPLIPARPGAAEAEVFAVGHGLSVLVRSAEGRAILYDCGKMGDPHAGRRIIAPALWSRGVRSLDAIVLTHPDADHYNGLPDLLDRFPVAEVLVPPGFEGPKNPGAKRLLDDVRLRGVPLGEVVAGNRLDRGGLRIGVLHPPREARDDSTDNARSVVLEVESLGRRLLLTGDLERDGLSDLMARPIAPLDALLAPHHGGRTANPPTLYAWADPGLVVVSQRPPAAGTRDPLAPIAEAGRFPLLRTWERGAIRLRWEPGGLVARGFLDPPASSIDPTFSSRIRASMLNAAITVIPGIALGLALFLIVTAVEWGAWSLVMPGRRLGAPAPPAPGGLPEAIPIEATAPDGVRLAGGWFPDPEARGRTALLLHGLAESRASLLGRVDEMVRLGWNVAVLDARASGASGGTRISFGGREADDLRAWIDALTPLSGPSPRFAAWGRSMGAATALKAAATDPRIAALVLEAPYRDLASAVRITLRRLRVPGVLAPLLLLRARMLAGVRLDRPRPIDLAPGVGVPVLIIHGSADRLVPESEARRLASAFPNPARILIVPGAGHGDAVTMGGPALLDEVGAFLESAIGPTPS
ncbi:ComEC/Rec2 family competence protein [Tundrisphaera sp. TA3]|uniref:ComEC/Rec2 family competence protein n=1 Tax=Tundrisphaera sp. TA3 TaxID=3435775 RepID=UPI003EB6AEB4